MLCSEQKMEAVSPRCSIKKPVLKNFVRFTGKHLCRSLINKLAGLQPETLLKSRLRHKYFPVNFAKFFRTTIL